MHRVRQSLPYFREMGWAPHVMAVDPAYVHRTQDDLLLNTIPDDVPVERVSALSTKWTRLLGIGNLALRSLGSLLRAGNRVLRHGSTDLVYFSTTAFPVMVLGRYWKARYDIPYVIDMHDPWRPDYYLDEPPEERPPKFWLAYVMHGCMEPIAMNGVDAIISVSQGYCDTLTERYDGISSSDCTVIPFGAAENDFSVLEEADLSNPVFNASDDTINVVYLGRGGHDMSAAAHGLFGALARGLDEDPGYFGKVQMYFVGTSYAEEGEGEKTFAPIAAAHGVEDHVTEHPARVPYFQALHLMREADMLVVPGSDDPNYTASKLYPYILSRTPLLAVFNQQSSVIDVLHETEAGRIVSFSADSAEETLSSRILETWSGMLRRLPYTPETDWEAFEPYTAREMTRRQVEVFERVVR